MRSSDVSSVFDRKARQWSCKGRWATIRGNDCPLDHAAASLVSQAHFVVDVGGGDGKSAERLADLMPDGCIVVVDLSRQMVKRAARRLTGASGGMKYSLVANADHVPLPSSMADVVLLRQVLHHVPSPAATLAEVYRLLRPRGAVLVQVPGPGYLGDLTPFPGSHAADNIGRFSSQEIGQLLEAARLHSEVWTTSFRVEYRDLEAAMQHFLSVGLLERLLGYRPGSSRMVAGLLDSPLIRCLLHRYSGPFTVSAEYVAACGTKEH